MYATANSIFVSMLVICLQVFKKALLTCETTVRSQGNLTLRWTKGNVTISDNCTCDDHEIETTCTNSTVKSTLEFTVNASTVHWYGDYSCVLLNETDDTVKIIFRRNFPG